MANNKPLLVGDVGGTNVRLAIACDGALSDIKVFAADNFSSLGAVIQAYISELGAEAKATVTQAVIDMATPIASDRVQLTNRPDWAFSIAELTQRLGFSKMHFINDFTALALSIPFLTKEDVLTIGAGDQDSGDGNIALIGPGTGLGVSGLVETGQGYLPIAGEGGHVTYSGVTPREVAITQHMQKTWGHVSAERLLAGSGIVNLYRAICELDAIQIEYDSAKAISMAAQEGESAQAQEALEHFFNILGTVTGNLAVTLGSFGGVYLGGGILPKQQQSLMVSGFYDRFLAHGRFHDYLAKMPLYLITNPYAALKGCAAANHGLYSHLGVAAER